MKYKSIIMIIIKKSKIITEEKSKNKIPQSTITAELKI